MVCELIACILLPIGTAFSSVNSAAHQLAVVNCSHEYQQLLKQHHLICGMSKKGDCHDNAAMESWHHSLKVETIHGGRFATGEQAKQQVFDYIEVYYNRQRLHSTLGYLSPMQFELKHAS